MKTCVPSTQPRHMCTICGKSYASVKLLARHTKTVHPTSSAVCNGYRMMSSHANEATTCNGSAASRQGETEDCAPFVAIPTHSSSYVPTEQNEMESKLVQSESEDNVAKVETVPKYTETSSKNIDETANDFPTDTILRTIAVSPKHKLDAVSVRYEITQPKTAEGMTKNMQPNDHRHDTFNGVSTSVHAPTETTKHSVVKSILKRFTPTQNRKPHVTLSQKTDDESPTFVTVRSSVPDLRSVEDNVDDVIRSIMALGMSAWKDSESFHKVINVEKFAYVAVPQKYDSIRHLQK